MGHDDAMKRTLLSDDMKTILPFIILLFLPLQLIGANIYVSTTGNDTTGNGSIGTPYRTIAKAVSVMSSGDDIYLRGGTYYESMINITGISGTEANPCSMQSYPGEWAVIDGGHIGGIDTDNDIIYATTISWWVFERMEITGGGGNDFDLLNNYGSPNTYPDSNTFNGAAFNFYKPRYVTFRYLYIHDNHEETKYQNGGINLRNDSGAANNITIEFCHFKSNGNPVRHTDANGNICISSDYAYDGPVDVEWSQHKNIIRYNLFDGSHASGYIDVAVANKAPQRLTGWIYGESENEADNTPNGSAYREYGDKTHHNIIINHAQGMRCEQDYAQFYNNIVDLTDGAGGEGDCGWAGSDQTTPRRGAYWPGVYNNTFFLDGTVAGIRAFGVSAAHDCLVQGTSSELDDLFVANNILKDSAMGTLRPGIQVCDLYNNYQPQNCTSPAPVDLGDLELSRNVYYGGSGTVALRVHDTFYTVAQIVSAGMADRLYSIDTSPFIGSSGADKYKVTGSYELDEDYIIATGGLGGDHPYLSGVTIPSYVGAVNPSDSDWVAGVLALDVTYFTSATAGSDPSWIEGSGSSPSTPTIRNGSIVNGGLR